MVATDAYSEVEVESVGIKVKEIYWRAWKNLILLIRTPVRNGNTPNKSAKGKHLDFFQ